jgi:hypothetical protein
MRFRSLSCRAVKRAKNATDVQQLDARMGGTYDELSGSEDGAGRASTSHAVAAGAVPPTSSSMLAKTGSMTATRVARGPSVTSCSNSSVRAWEAEVQRLLAAGRAEDAIRWAAPSDGMIRCTVRRVKNFVGHTVSIGLFLDSGDTFVLAARKRKKSKASNYLLCTSQDDLSKDSEACVGKLRANFVGTEYGLVSRTSPSSAGDASSSSSSGGGRLAPPAEPFGCEDLAVHFKQTALTSKGGPRVMLVATPLPETSWAPAAPDGSDGLCSSLELARRRELPPKLERQLCMLATRPPEWSAESKTYALDFNGRVRAASTKNFQLVHWDHNTDRKGSDLGECAARGVVRVGAVRAGMEGVAARGGARNGAGRREAGAAEAVRGSSRALACARLTLLALLLPRSAPVRQDLRGL